MNGTQMHERTVAPALLLFKRKAKIMLTLAFIYLMSMSAFAQNCQGSFDQQDIMGDLYIHREFRCGTAMMQDRMLSQRMKREQKGYFEIDGLNFYGSDGYYTKNNLLYYCSLRDKFALVPKGDIASIEIVGNFIRDKNAVYCRGKAQDIVNVSTFKPILNTPYAKDDKHVYFNAERGGNSPSDEIHVVPDADPKYFTSLCYELSSGGCYYYGKDKTNVYHSGKIIEGADPGSFELMDNGYAIDANYIYYDGKRLEGSSGKSYKKIDYYYVLDKNNVYFFGDLVPEMNGAKFTLLGESGMGTDGVRISYQSKVFENSDPKTFVDLGCGYYKDANNVYSKGQILSYLDPKTFEILSWGYTKDKNGVYCDDGIIPDADPSTFDVLGRKYGRDRKNVFYLRTLLPKCNRVSFVVDSNDPNSAEDSKATYVRGIPTNK